MGTQLIVEWSAPEDHRDRTEQALAAVRVHIAAEHPQIRSVRLLHRHDPATATVTYRWLEEYEDAQTLDGMVDTPACTQVWEPVYALAVPDSQHETVWTDLPLR